MRRQKWIFLGLLIIANSHYGFCSKNDSLDIVANGKIYLQYYNEFDDVIDFSLNDKETKRIYYNGTFAIVQSKFLLPSIFIKKDSQTITFKNTGEVEIEETDLAKNKVNQNETLFFSELNKQTGYTEGGIKAFIRWPRVGLDQIDYNVSKSFNLPLPRKNFLLRDVDVESRNKIRVEFLNKFKANHSLSGQFLIYVKAYLKYLYLVDKMRVFSNEKFEMEMLNSQFYLDLEKLTLTIENDSDINIFYYRQALKFYLYYLVKKQYKVNPKTDYDKLFHSILTNFKGLSKDYLLFIITKDHLSKLSKEQLQQFDNSCNSSKYKNYIKNTVETNLKRNQLTNGIYLIDEQNKLLSWKEMLEKYKNSLLYIDWWATWCGPCMEEQSSFLQLSDSYMGKQIKFITISLDHEINNWKSNISAQGLNPNRINFLIKDVKSAKILGVEHIPRYMLIDKNGNIIEANAPNASSQKLAKQIETYLLNQTPF